MTFSEVELDQIKKIIRSELMLQQETNALYERLNVLNNFITDMTPRLKEILEMGGDTGLGDRVKAEITKSKDSIKKIHIRLGEISAL